MRFSPIQGCLLALATGLLLALPAFSQVYKDPKAPVEAQVDAVLAAMTLDEKLDYIGGYKYFSIRGIGRPCSRAG